MTEKEIKDLQDQLAKAKADLETSRNLNKSLQDDIVAQETAKAPAAQAAGETALLPEKPVKVDGKNYKVTFPRFIHKGKEYTAHQAHADQALLKEMIEMGHGGIVEVR